MWLWWWVGCADGSVDLEEEPFGRVKSSVWFEFRQDLPEGDDPQYHWLFMSTEGGACKTMQDLVQPLADSYDQHFSIVPYDDEETCTLTRAYYEEAAVLVDDLFGKKGANHLLLEPYDPDGDIDDPPDADPPDGTVYVQDRSDTQHYFFGNVTLASRNPWAAVAEEIRCGADSAELGADIDEAMEETVQTLYLSSGSLTLVERQEGAVLKLFDFAGTVVDDDGDNRGAIEAKGSFEHCPVDWTGGAEPPLLRG